MAEKQELVIKINGDIKGYQDSLKKVSSQTEDLQKRLGSIAKASAAAFAGFGGAIAFATAKAAKFETIETQFEVLTGSVSKAKETIADLSEFSATTPFQFEDIAKAGKQLLGFQVPAKDLKSTLRSLGDVSAALGTPFSDLTLIFGQVKAAGKLTGERLLQLQERAVPIGPALAKTMGVAESAIKGMVSKGQIDFKTFEKAFNSLSEEGGAAFKGMEKNSRTLAGQISTMSDNFDLATAAVGKHFIPIIKEVAGVMTGFFQFLQQNPALTEFISKALIVGTVAAGIMGTVSLLGIGFLKLRAAMIASTLATRGLSFAVKGLIGATGLGLLVAFLPEILAAFKFVFNGAKNIVKNAGDSIANAASALGKILGGLFTFNFDDITTGFQQFKTAFSEVAEATAKEFSSASDKIKKAEADKTKQLKEEVNKRKTLSQTETVAVDVELEKRKQKLKDEIELTKAKNEDMTKQEIDFIKRRQKLRAEDKEIGIIQNEEEKNLALENSKLKHEELLAEEAEYRIVKAEQEAEQREQEQILKQELQELDKQQRDSLRKEELKQMKSNFKTDAKLRSQAAAAAIAEKRKEHETFLADEMRYGTRIAQFRAMMRSEEYNNARTAANELSQLQNSKNKEMREIGKAAALVQIAIDTQRGALAAYTALAGIPVVGPGLGIAAAAALTAYGVERAQRVQAAQTGGIVEGRGFGDTVPFMLEPGELITPRQNFDEVVNAVADQRAGAREAEEGEPAESQTMMVEIGFDGEEAADVLTVKQNEQRALGISQEF